MLGQSSSPLFGADPARACRLVLLALDHQVHAAQRTVSLRGRINRRRKLPYLVLDIDQQDFSCEGLC
jgi:hypothetical protein